MSDSLPEIPGKVWLKLAMPVDESVRGAYDTMPAADRWRLEQEIRQAAVDALHQMMGVPLRVLNEAVPG